MLPQSPATFFIERWLTVSRQQPHRHYPKIMSTRPLTRTGSTQFDNISDVSGVFWSELRKNRGKPLSNPKSLPGDKRHSAKFPKKQSCKPSKAGERGDKALDARESAHL